ncbi:MAG: hypothetical protein ABI592_02030 [Acidobacteriota bacterium]
MSKKGERSKSLGTQRVACRVDMGSLRASRLFRRKIHRSSRPGSAAGRRMPTGMIEKPTRANASASIDEQIVSVSTPLPNWSASSRRRVGMSWNGRR